MKNRRKVSNAESLIEELKRRKELHLVSNNINPCKQAIADELDALIKIVSESVSDMPT